jgi:hypothetical protein
MKQSDAAIGKDLDGAGATERPGKIKAISKDQ